MPGVFEDYRGVSGGGGFYIEVIFWKFFNLDINVVGFYYSVFNFFGIFLRSDIFNEDILP